MIRVIIKNVVAKVLTFDISRINKLSVYLPPLGQQQEIISKIDYLFNELKTLEMRYNYLCEILDKLPQTILNKAFKGKLL